MLTDGDESQTSDNGVSVLNEEIKCHKSYDQVMLDVDRCGGGLSLRKKEKLAELIVRTLFRKSNLHYYQGFHDVCLTYLRMLGYRKAYKKLDEVVDTHFKTFMQPTMHETQEFLQMLPIIIGLHDQKTQIFLEKSEVGTIFALSWVITWFSHEIRDKNVVEKIFKYLESQDSHMILYLCASLVINDKERLLKLEAEMSTVHHFLCQLPKKETMPIGKLIEHADDAFSRWSPTFVKEKLDEHRRNKARLERYNMLRSYVSNLTPTVYNIVATNSKTAILVVLLASAFAIQFERWTR